MLRVIKYTNDKKSAWDDLVKKAKNGTFLFYRDYMEYHADRFEDYSLMVYKKNKLVALFPANIVDDTVYSHQGLTFGGIIHTNTSLQFLDIFNSIISYLDTESISNFEYKAIPQIYKNELGDEEYYALYRCDAELISCNLSSCIDLRTDFKVSRNRKRNYKKSIEQGLKVEKSTDFEAFWEIMENNMMERFNAKPVHTVQEIYSLHLLFAKNIELWLTTKDNVVLSGAVIYKYNHVIKVQYAHANAEGKKSGAIDAIYFHLIDLYRENFKYIDFGTSCTNNGLVINEGLLNQKESFGARGVTFNTYKINS